VIAYGEPVFKEVNPATEETFIIAEFPDLLSRGYSLADKLKALNKFVFKIEIIS
jgi:hypothetical protein